MMVDGRKGLTRPRAKPASSAVVEARIGQIRAMMREGLWRRGESQDALAAEWGVTESTVRDYSGEAWRRVCREANDADRMRPTIAGTLAVALAEAAAERDHQATAKLGDTLSRVIGARAPERHEHAVVVAQYEALPREGKAAWLRERAEQLLAEAARLEAEPER